MQTQWIFSSTFLPYTGEPIDFRLEDREQPIHGIFADGSFHSRWADYDANRVNSWRGSEGDPVVAQVAVDAAPTGGFSAMLKRLIRPSAAKRNAVPTPLHSHARKTATPVAAMQTVAVTVAVAVVRRIDSNQMSS